MPPEWGAFPREERAACGSMRHVDSGGDAQCLIWPYRARRSIDAPGVFRVLVATAVQSHHPPIRIKASYGTSSSAAFAPGAHAPQKIVGTQVVSNPDNRLDGYLPDRQAMAVEDPQSGAIFPPEGGGGCLHRSEQVQGYMAHAQGACTRLHGKGSVGDCRHSGLVAARLQG